MNLLDYTLKEKYYRYVSMFEDRLSNMSIQIGWKSLRSIFDDLYRNNTVEGGAPNIDPILMIKILFLQSVYNLVDEHVEREMHNRIDFMHFLGFPRGYRIQEQYGSSVKGSHPRERIRSCGRGYGNSLRIVA